MRPRATYLASLVLLVVGASSCAGRGSFESRSFEQEHRIDQVNATIDQVAGREVPRYTAIRDRECPNNGSWSRATTITVEIEVGDRVEVFMGIVEALEDTFGVESIGVSSLDNQRIVEADESSFVITHHDPNPSSHWAPSANLSITTGTGCYEG